MENLIGWLLIAVLLAVPVLLVVGGLKLRKHYQQKKAEASRKLWENAQSDSKARADRELEILKDRARRLNLATPTKSYSRSSSFNSAPPAPTKPDDNSSLLSDLATMYVLNAALNHGSASAKVDYDSGTIETKSGSSWGLDDDDSRKSASSSFSSSDSSSSWDSSSSDSGPSSDW